MLSSLLYRGLQGLGVTALARRVRAGGVILCYHNVVPPDTPGGAPGVHMPLDRFRAQMRWLAAHYDVVPVSALVDRLARGQSIRGTACVTFDDAYAGVFTHAWPVLRELRLTATVFVIAGAPAGGRRFWWDHPAAVRASTAGHSRPWLTELRGDEDAILASLSADASAPPAAPAAHLPAPWDVIATAARTGMEVGVHSATHRALPILADGDLNGEIEQSREVVARNTGTAPSVFAYPYGLWDPRVRSRVERAGYRAALTLDYGLVAARSDVWALPRVNVPSGMSEPAFQAWAAGLNLRHAPRGRRP
jgi:peptidoglycan/xylan/chitin deacetylase (PgdA/CDA1 family)